MTDMDAVASAGFRSIICSRPDGEAADQPTFEEIEAAAKAKGLEARYLPVTSGKVRDQDAKVFFTLTAELPKPVLAYCRTGTRSITLWSLAEGAKRPLPEILEKAKAAGYDIGGVVRRIAAGGKTPIDVADASHDIVFIGGGAAGIAVASSLIGRDRNLDIAVIDPVDIHYYQPGWTVVGGGVFDAHTTARTMGSLIPRDVHWIKAGVAAFEPEDDAVILNGCRVVKYKCLTVCPGLKLDWHGV